jgi:transglutaminase-like putative cysteine protease
MMYTTKMQKSSDTTRWWDWTSIVLLFIIVETSASRLVATNWTDFLFLGQAVAYIAFTVGVALGYSRFSPRLSRLISFLYMLVFLPLLWTLVIDQKASLEEQLLSVSGRLLFSYSDFLARNPVEDPFFFITLITLGFWIIGASAGFQLLRRQNYLAAVLPSAVVLLVIQSYDAREGRIWIIAVFAFMALLLLGRMNHLSNKSSWRERRVFLSPDNNIDLTSIMTIAAGLIILVSWSPPTSAAGLDSAIQTWNRLTRPWREFTERMENAVRALESPSGGVRGEFYGSEIALGRGFPLSEMVMFRVLVPDLSNDERPPRYYWRGHTYDHYLKNQWYTTGSSMVDYSPGDTPSIPLPLEASEPSRFIFQTGELAYSLVYAPSQPVWFSRQGSTRNLPAGGRQEIISWFAYPALQAGETYQVDAVLSNPNTRQLREAGQFYPAWVTEKYLQLPPEFSPQIIELAEEITADQDNPYDKALVITRYLRTNIAYADVIPEVPRNQDPLEWMLFENKQAFCLYYASAEVLMLRSLDIPARLAVGFAEGEQVENQYTVRKLDAHAWPEVYFPGLGWVEFEPTGSQPVLNRPLPPRDEDDLGTPLRDLPLLDDLENNPENFRGLQDEEGIAIPDLEEAQPLNPAFYLIPLFTAFAALAVYFSRRYSVPDRIPVILRASYERAGAQTPAWIVNWERWVNISLIERAFDSVNFSLRLLERPMPVDATPIERARGLMSILPQAKNEIIALLDEHQTSLYTSRTADAARARRAAIRIRWQALIERLRYVLDGRPIESP